MSLDGVQKDSDESARAEQCQERGVPRLCHRPAGDICSRPALDPGDQDNKLSLRRYVLLQYLVLATSSVGCLLEAVMLYMS